MSRSPVLADPVASGIPVDAIEWSHGSPPDAVGGAPGRGGRGRFSGDVGDPICRRGLHERRLDIAGAGPGLPGDLLFRLASKSQVRVLEPKDQDLEPRSRGRGGRVHLAGRRFFRNRARRLPGRRCAPTQVLEAESGTSLDPAHRLRVGSGWDGLLQLDPAGRPRDASHQLLLLARTQRLDRRRPAQVRRAHRIRMVARIRRLRGGARQVQQPRARRFRNGEKN